MQEKYKPIELIVDEEYGIHARPAANIVKLSQTFEKERECKTHIESDGNKVRSSSIMGIITLGAMYNSKVLIYVDPENHMEDYANLLTETGYFRLDQ